MDPHTSFSECKVCGDDLETAHPLFQVVGVCEVCQKYFSASRPKKKKKKPTYNLG